MGSSSGAGSFGDLRASFDLDILDCNICAEVLSPPIHQCCNGHYTCSECKRKMNNRCPTCAEPAGKIRNLGLEKILESLKISCKFQSQGCTELALPYKLKKKHEQNCSFSPRDCPVPDCNFSGRLDSFNSHFENCHGAQIRICRFHDWFTVQLSMNDKYLILKGGNVCYLLQAYNERVGKLLYISHATPPSSVDSYDIYEMEVKAGNNRLTLSSDIQRLCHGIPNLDVIGFLLVPQCILGSTECFGGRAELQVKILIKRICFIRAC